MSSQTSSHQEILWRGEFGDKYIDRNEINDCRLAARITMWERILRGIVPASVLEIGANVGINLRAIQQLRICKSYALEPNAKARTQLAKIGVSEILNGISTDIDLPNNSVDLVFTSGVLIHVPPHELLQSCSEIYRVSQRYIVCIEYFSDKPETMEYRGQSDALFKRDFGGFYLDNFTNLKIVDYGFLWKRAVDIDNLTWWLFEKPKLPS